MADWDGPCLGSESAVLEGHPESILSRGAEVKNEGRSHRAYTLLTVRPGPSRVQRQIEKKELQLRKIAHEMAQKDDLKTVALGTSKINYMDPRISVAWCKKHEVPIEKVGWHLVALLQ